MTREVEQLVSALERTRLRLAGTEDAAIRRLLTILADIEEQIVRSLQAGLRGTLTPSKAAELFAQISRISENGLLAQAEWLQEMLPRITTGALAMDGATLSVVGFSAETISETFAAFEGTDRYTALLNNGYQTWWNEVLGRNEEYLRTLQAELTRGGALNMSGKTIADNLVAARGKLDIEVADPQVWAERLVRTETTRIANDMHVAFAEEAGVETFINVGIADERQSDECAAASLLEPMTKEEWQAGPGLPPRHPNCRCDLVAWLAAWGFDLKEVQEAASREFEGAVA